MSSVRHVRLFRNGRNQAVRIPKEFELEDAEAVIVGEIVSGRRRPDPEPEDRGWGVLFHFRSSVGE